MDDKREIDEALAKGAEKARAVAADVLTRVRERAANDGATLRENTSRFTFVGWTGLSSTSAPYFVWNFR